MKTSKLKIAVVIGLLCCMAMGMSVMAFDRYPSYHIGSNETKQIESFVPHASTIYLNTRPSTGGDVTIILEGAVSGSGTFPYYTSRTDWKVPNVARLETLRVNGRAGSSGSSGILHIWS